MSKIVLLLLIAPAFSSAPGPFRGLIDSIKLKGSPPGIFDSFLSLSNDAAKKARANLATIPPTTTTTTTTVRPPSPKPQKPVTEHPLKAKKPPSPGTAKDDVHEMMNLNIIQAMEDFSKLSDQEEFALTDKNKDGQVTLLELHKAIRAYDPAGIDFSNDGVIEWFKDLDTDKNGKITLFEYLLTLKRQAKQKNQDRNMIAMRFRRYFDEADTNGNQKLSLAEAAAFATKYRFSEKKLLDAFNLSDKNKDKQLQFDEFVISFPAV